MKPRLLELVSETSTAESVYAEKYEWLMRWALHFCNGDREMAEDLVQDTFVRMISSWQSIRDLENPERFLYTYLKYGFLRLRAEDRRQTMQSISVDDLDSLDRKLPGSEPDLLEWQQDLRAVVDFLCWRKSTAKSASLLLLRFFHGLFPAEIMAVARLTRKAVDDGLASARHEVRTCATKRPLAGDASSRPAMRLPSHFSPHIVSPPLSTEDLMRQMLLRVFAAPEGECLSIAALRERYSERSRSPIDCWLLSHIVSCQRCLDSVLDMHTLPPRGTRPLEDVLGYAPKAEGTRPRKKTAPISAAMRSMAAARLRYRETLQTRPRTISVAVDGQSLASRDVSSPLNKLTVDLRSGSIPELIEICGDTAPLLSVPIYATPPGAEPVQHFHVELLDGCSIQLALEFNAAAVRLHVTYNNELLSQPAAPALNSPLPSFMSEEGRGGDAEYASKSRLRAKMKEWLSRSFPPVLKFSVAFAGAGLVCVAGYRYIQAPQPYTVLTQAVKAVRQQTTGVVTQRVRIASRNAHGSSTYDATLHRDLARKLKPRPQQASHMSENDPRMESARIAWSDPLSPANFRQWRDEQREASDELLTTPDGRVTVTSRVSTGPVAEESLTLNAQTFHAVKRVVRFRDSEEIEVAELDYSVIPLASSDPAWFEPPASIGDPQASRSLAHPPVAPLGKLPATHLSGEQFDIAELSVRLAMIELQADGRERLTLRREKDGVVVEGLVATDERKHEIEKRIRQITHVTTAINTFADFALASSVKRDGKGHDANALASVTVSSATDSLSPLDRFSAEQHVSVERLNALHASLFHAATELKQNATAMRDLDERFRRVNPSPDTVDLRSTLRNLYISRMKSATEKETRALTELGIALREPAAEPNAALPDVATTNAQLCFELISQADDLRPAQTILRDLADSVRTVQRSLNEMTMN